jgi:hypothetical protein
MANKMLKVKYQTFNAYATFSKSCSYNMRKAKTLSLSLHYEKGSWKLLGYSKFWISFDFKILLSINNEEKPKCVAQILHWMYNDKWNNFYDLISISLPLSILHSISGGSINTLNFFRRGSGQKSTASVRVNKS